MLTYTDENINHIRALIETKSVIKNENISSDMLTYTDENINHIYFLSIISI